MGSVFPWRLILSLFNCSKKNEQKFSYMLAKAGVSYFSMRLESKSTLNLRNDLCTDHIFFFLQITAKLSEMSATYVRVFRES